MVLCGPCLEEALGGLCCGAEGSWDLGFLEPYSGERAYPGKS